MHQVQQLYNIGVEIEENSELDALRLITNTEGDEENSAVVKRWKKSSEQEIKSGSASKLAQYEITCPRKTGLRSTEDTENTLQSLEKMLAAFQTHSSDSFHVM